MDSAEQDQWRDICAAYRAQMAKAVPLMPAMTPEELAALAAAIDAGMENEVKAHSHDEAVEERRKTLERQAQFGG